MVAVRSRGPHRRTIQGFGDKIVSQTRGLTYICAAAATWGTSGIVAAFLYRTSGLGPIAVAFWRAACGVAVLYAASALLRRSRPAPRRHPAAFFAAVRSTGVAVATVVTLGAGPVLIALGARAALGERLGRAGAVAVGLAGAGLLLLVGGGLRGSAVTTTGVLLSLLSGTGYAVVTVLNRRHGGDPVRTTATGFLMAGACLLPLALIEGVVPHRVDARTVVLVAYLGAVPTAVAYGLFFAGLAVVRATTVSVLTLMEPLTATTIAVTALGERLTVPVALGGVVLLAAVTLLARAERASPSSDGGR